MKTAGEIFRKLKEAKFRHWVVIYKKLSRKNPSNCKYNYQYRIAGNQDTQFIGLCLLHQDSIDWKSSLGESNPCVKPHLIDICQADIDCQNCNGYIQKYTREEMKDLFLNELNTKQIKEKKYPEICALEWVLEKQGYHPIPWFQALYFRIKMLLNKYL